MKPFKHSGFTLAFLFTIGIFLFPLISMRASFIYGDNLVQFYPWFKIYADSIKHLQLPFWTTFMQSGFPLMAEGQVGGWYPLNMLMFFLLPFRIAYNYSIILHFILGGVFTYFYSRRVGADEAGGYLAALLFCFGSAYAGCFYNIITLRTLAWFPLVLLLFEIYLDKRKISYMFLAGLVAGFQLLAGFIQVAAYSVLFYLAYFIYTSSLRKIDAAKTLFSTGTFLLTAFIVSLPQLMLTFQLANLSSREGATLGFALWGSLSPIKLLGTVFPYFVLKGTTFYIGIFSLLLLITSFYSMRSDLKMRPLLMVFLLSFFLALGKYNPLYFLALKITRFYSFRNPSKFLFFGMFAASVLAGTGLTRFFRSDFQNKRPIRIFKAFLIAMAGIFFAFKAIILIFGGKLIKFGKWYAINYIYGKDFHRHSLQTYMEKVESFYAGLVQKSSILNPFILTSIGLCIIALIFCGYILRKKKPAPIFKGILVLIIFLDLFVYSFYGTGFRGNIRNFNELGPAYPLLYKIVANDKEIFRILPYDVASGKLPNWAMPNSNAIWNIDSVAAYSPLVSEKYYKKLNGLEAVDNSLGLLTPSEGAFRDKWEILRLLNVKYVVSSEEIKEHFFERNWKEKDIYMYSLKNALPRGYVIAHLQEPLRFIDKDPKITEYRSGYAKFSLDIRENAYLVFSEFNYPGWKAAIDGKKAKIESFQDILMAVHVPKGEHEVEFKYTR